MRHLCGGAYVIRAHTASAPESSRLCSRALSSLQNVTDHQTDLVAVVLSTQLPGNGNYRGITDILWFVFPVAS